jgi:hypothetical protein
MIINLYIYEQDNAFLAESSELCINSNIPALASTPIEFWGNTRQEVIDQVKQYARHKFGAGSLRIIK